MTFDLHPDLVRDGIFVGDFPLCRVLLINDAAYPWFVLVPRRQGVSDVIDLSDRDSAQLWTESRIFSKSIMALFQGDKLNIAALGNMTPQLHVHHIVRFKSDAAWPKPVWGQQPLTHYSDTTISEIRTSIKSLDLPDFKTL